MSTFTPYTPIVALIDNQMVDRWTNATDFVAYYKQCAPIECTYKVERYNSFTYVISLLIGLYGGLTVALRFMAPWIVKLARRLCAVAETRKQARIHAAQGIGLLSCLR